MFMALSLFVNLSHAAVTWVAPVKPNDRWTISGGYTITPISLNPPRSRINWSAAGPINGAIFGGMFPAYYVIVPPQVSQFPGAYINNGADNGAFFGYLLSSPFTADPSPVQGYFDVYGNYGETVTISEMAGCAEAPFTDWPSADYVAKSINYTFGDPRTYNFGNSGPSPVNQPNNSVAEPVSATTGAFYENQADLHVNGPLPIEVRRTYSSLNTNAMNEFGYGWLPGYSSYLIPSDSTADPATIQAADADGSIIVFRQRPGSTTVWSPMVADNSNLTNSAGGAANLFNSTIVQSTVGSTVTYAWNLPDGSVRTYVVQSFPITISGVTFTHQYPYLRTWADNRGNQLTFAYGAVSTANDYGRINLIKSSNGSSVSFTCDTEGHILQAAANDGRTVNYTYDPAGAGDLMSVQLPDGNTINYQYGAYPEGDSNHLITQVTKPDGSILQNTYDSLGRVLQQSATVDQANPTTPVNTATFDYSVQFQTTVTDAYNNSTVYQYTSGGLIMQITDPLGHSPSPKPGLQPRLRPAHLRATMLTACKVSPTNAAS